MQTHQTTNKIKDSLGCKLLFIHHSRFWYLSIIHLLVSDKHARSATIWNQELCEHWNLFTILCQMTNLRRWYQLNHFSYRKIFRVTCSSIARKRSEGKFRLNLIIWYKNVNKFQCSHNYWFHIIAFLVFLIENWQINNRWIPKPWLMNK